MASQEFFTRVAETERTERAPTLRTPRRSLAHHRKARCKTLDSLESALGRFGSGSSEPMGNGGTASSCEVLDGKPVADAAGHRGTRSRTQRSRRTAGSSVARVMISGHFEFSLPRLDRRVRYYLRPGPVVMLLILFMVAAIDIRRRVGLSLPPPTLRAIFTMSARAPRRVSVTTTRDHPDQQHLDESVHCRASVEKLLFKFAAVK